MEGVGNREISASTQTWSVVLEMPISQGSEGASYVHSLYINLICVCKDIYVNEYWKIEFCILCM